MTPFKNTSATQPKSRNPLLWPFSTDSVWNTPIGSKAQYVDAKIQSAKVISSDVDHFFALDSNDPKRDVYKIGGWTNRSRGTRDQGFDLPIPDELIIPDTNSTETPNNSTAFLMPDGETLMQFNATTRSSVGGKLYGVKYPFGNLPNETLTSEGAIGGHGGSGLSSIGGTIRLGELTGDEPIRHALKLNLWAKKYFSYSDSTFGGKGYRWPAIKADGYANASSYGGKVPALAMGSLLAIPPNATPESLGLKTEPAKKIFYALQDYGAYVVDDTAWDAHSLGTENGVMQEFRHEYGYDFKASSGEFYDDMMSLFSSLNVITNNGPNSVGGGGTPRAPLAPDIDSSYVDQLQQLMADPTVEDSFEADFNGDGHTDLLWRNLATGSNHVWLQNKDGKQVGGGNILPLTDPDWQIKTVRDTDKDGEADVVWHNRTTGAEQVWHLDDLRMWVDPQSGRHVNRWMKNASGSPRIEFTKSGTSDTPLPDTDITEPPQPTPDPSGGALPNPAEPVPTPVTGNGNGLKGVYFNDQNFKNAVLTRTDSTIDFQWKKGSPNQAIAPNTFSTRWTGKIEPRYSETYKFSSFSDNGMRVWVDGEKIIDHWVATAPKEVNGSIDLKAGQRYRIKVEYFEKSGGAAASLSWSSPSQEKEIVPQSQLYSARNLTTTPEPAPDPIVSESLSSADAAEPATSPIPTAPSAALDLRGIQSYEPNKQDKTSSVSFSDQGKAVRIQGNAWKSLPLNYKITPDTQLSVEFRSGKEGDIHALSFDTNTKLDGGEKRRAFKFSGTQTWGNREFDDYVTQSGWKEYTIPVGEFFQGDMDHLLLINDHDVSNPNAISEFRNIELFETSNGVAGVSESYNDSLLPTSGSSDANALLVNTAGLS